MSDPRWPDDGPIWPERDLNGEDAAPNPWADAPDAGIDAEPPLPEPEAPEPVWPDEGFAGGPPAAAEPPEPAFPEPVIPASPFS